VKKHRLPRLPVASVDPGRLLSLVDDFERTRVVVFGDLIVDEFIYGELSRVSREAPVLILDYDSTEIVPGGAGNAASNVSALGGAATAVGAAGRDDTGRRLLDVMRRGVDIRSVVRPAAYRTPTKTRILAGGVHSAKQQVVRIDRGTRPALSDADRRAIESRLLAACARADALLVSDYGMGVATPAVVARARARLKTKKAGRPPTLIDSRYGLLGFRGMAACTPNESEVEHLLGVRIGENAKILEKAGRELLERTRSQAVLVTRGSRGMAVFERNQPTIHIPIFGSDQIADVTGAGDTVIATMTLALASGATFLEAARLANYAGGLVVMKRGTATVSADELRQAILSDT
jgi:D-glycero-beta-D-manno-heptose-7-phosphate kinase